MTIKPVAAIERLQNLGFSGSYHHDDVIFLLQKLNLKPTANEEKEQLIQSGKKHYSQMIGDEQAPSKQHLALYEQALEQGAERFAREITESVPLTQLKRFLCSGDEKDLPPIDTPEYLMARLRLYHEHQYEHQRYQQNDESP